MPSGIACRIRLLGPPTIQTPVGSVSAAKTFVFGAALYLGLHRGRAVGRAQLSALLWPDADAATRSERLRWLMRQLRQAGLPSPTRTPQIELSVDLVRLDIDDLEDATTLAEVLQQGGGELLHGYDPNISDTFGRWLDETRDALRSRVIRVLGRWLAEARRVGNWAAVEELARRTIALDELHEQASLALVEALLMEGRGDQAARALARFRTESGSDATTASVRQIQQQLNELAADNASAPRRTPLVGRAEVLARLLESIDAGARSTRRIGIAGPPGIGKTRTLDEFATVARLRGTRVARMRCGRADALRPLSLAADLARQLLDMRGALGADPKSIDVLRRFLGETAAPANGVSPDARRAEVYAALDDLIGALVDDGPVAVVADDVQWAEPGSWTILGPLVSETPEVSWSFGLRCESAAAASRMLQPVFGEQEGEIRWLGPLASPEIVALCTARAAPRRIPSETMDLLVVRAAGIPFVAEALVEHWCEMGDLVSLPPSVQRLVAARVDRLSQPAVRMLEAMAVLGADADPPAVEAVTTLDRAALLDATRELDAAGIMRTADGVLTAHALWTEAVAARVPQSTLQLQHRYAAEWLEHVSALSAVPDQRRHWAIATHWLEASDPERARLALDRAAEVLLANGFAVNAGAMLERAGDIAGSTETALHYWRRAGEHYVLEQSPDILTDVARVHANYEALSRALYGFRHTPHHELEFWLIVVECRDSPTDERWMQRCVECALAPEATNMHRLRAAVRVMLISTMTTPNHARVAQVWTGLQSLRLSSAQERLEWDLVSAHYYARAVGDADRALQHALQARERVANDPSATSLDHLRVQRMLAQTFEYCGDLEHAQQARREILEQGQRIGSSTDVDESLSGLIGTELEAGRPWNARPLLPLFARRPSGNDSYLDRARSLYHVVCALEEGDVALAREELDLPLELADQEHGPMQKARIFAIHAHLALLEGDSEVIRELLPRLLDCFVGRLEYMDHPAYVAGRCLQRSAGTQAAAVFVTRFLTELRPERWTPRLELRQLAAGTFPADG